MDSDRLIGIATYALVGDRAELAALAATADRQRGGIGGRLVEVVASAAASKGADELWLVTTNDNLDALRLYQRHGFQLSAAHAGAVDRDRTMKPIIPPLGRHGIPIHDKLILVRPLADHRLPTSIPCRNTTRAVAHSSHHVAERPQPRRDRNENCRQHETSLD